MVALADLRVKLFADGADLAGLIALHENPLLRGFTTNPTLMRQANVADYRCFARDVLAVVRDRPVSFEVFSDEFSEMEAHAYEIASWGENVFVKIPVTDTVGRFCGSLIERLSGAGVQLNVTAVMTSRQVEAIARSLDPATRSFVSVFAGRIADTGRDPIPILERSLELLRGHPVTELMWASPREVLNVVQADAVGCHVITLTSDLLAKLSLLGKDLDEFSLDTVRMFRNDALRAGFTIDLERQAVTMRPA